MTENIHNQALDLAAYCTLQGKLLRLFDPSYDRTTMIREFMPLVSRAFRNPSEESLESLLKLSDDLSARITLMESQYPEIAASDDALEIYKILDSEKNHRLRNS